MKISPYATFQTEDIKYLDLYTSIYLCIKNINKQDIARTETSKSLCNILENIKKHETQNLYLKEIKKIQEFLSHNKTAEVPYRSTDMLKAWPSIEKMCKTTTQILIENSGLSEDELSELSEILRFKLKEDVDFLYEEIERNLDGRYGANYDELY